MSTLNNIFDWGAILVGLATIFGALTTAVSIFRHRERVYKERLDEFLRQRDRVLDKLKKAQNN